MTDILAEIMKRRSIRRYTDEPVSTEDIHKLLMAAMAAPSANNSKPWEFVAVTNAEKLAELRKVLPFGKFKAPLAIAVLGNPLIASDPSASLFWVQDCSAATENILIAAAGMGLGSCWIGVHPLPIAKSVGKVLHLPRHVKPLCIIYIGHPAETKEPRTQYDERRIHWQVYEKLP